MSSLPSLSHRLFVEAVARQEPAPARKPVRPPAPSAGFEQARTLTLEVLQLGKALAEPIRPLEPLTVLKDS